VEAAAQPEVETNAFRNYEVMETMSPRTASYAIDADDLVVWTDDGFADLAREHRRPDLADAAIGRPLVEFVAGDRARALQQALIERVRAKPSEPLELRYRCDAPDMRRFAVLRLTVRPNHSIVFTTWFELVEDRPYQSILDYEVPRGDGTARLCAWCNRVDAGDGWREPEDVETSERPPAVEHGVCEICELLLTSGPASRPGTGPTRSGPSGRP